MDVTVPCVVPTCFHGLGRGNPSKWLLGKTLEDHGREDHEGDGLVTVGKGGGGGEGRAGRRRLE